MMEQLPLSNKRSAAWFCNYVAKCLGHECRVADDRVDALGSVQQWWQEASAAATERRLYDRTVGLPPCGAWAWDAPCGCARWRTGTGRLEFAVRDDLATVEVYAGPGTDGDPEPIIRVSIEFPLPSTWQDHVTVDVIRPSRILWRRMSLVRSVLDPVCPGWDAGIAVRE